MISIVMPVYNHHEMTRECIEVIRRHTENYEIILIDNGSDPPMEAAQIRNETNLGFPKAVNQGIRAAKGDVIILLNNDVIVTPGWAERLSNHLDTGEEDECPTCDQMLGIGEHCPACDPDGEDADLFSIIAPMANYCAGLQQEIALPTYHDDQELFAVAKQWGEDHDKEFLEVNFVIGFCMAFRKSLWEEIGPFDESLWPCSGEEIDFCLRAREKGYRIAIARDAYVHHIGSQTFKEMEKAGQLNYMETINKNDAHLAKKWGNDFWKRQIGPLKGSIPIGPSNGAVRLNLGCGEYPIRGMINVDLRPHVNPDLVADALHLPYPPGTIDEIYAGHLLEHLTYDEGQVALRHWHSLLKTGGTVMITVPDFDVLAAQYLANPTAKNMRAMNDLYIFSYIQESHHRYCYGPALLKAAMTEAGFGALEKVQYDHPYFTSSMHDQITFRGVK